MLNKKKPHIGIFGRCNVGKSTFINTLSNQTVAIVSAFPGTTTDPVKKSIELGANIGPVILIDTAGTGDESELGIKRIEATLKIIREIDLAVLLISHNKWNEEEKTLVGELTKWKIPFFIVFNQSDLCSMTNDFLEKIKKETGISPILFSSVDGKNINEVLGLIEKKLPKDLLKDPSLLGDLVNYGDLVVLVTPIDIEAPKGRLILPQVQAIRDALDNECIVVVVKERELDLVFNKFQMKPKLVITDSQAFLKVSALVPKEIPLTSFSILEARLKGDFEALIEGTYGIEQLKEGDRVLILESCSHHIGGEDIGRVKIPRFLELYKGCKLHFDIVSGLDAITRPLESYSLVVQCGGCMLTLKQIQNRVSPFFERKIPVTNYGMCISYCLGIFERALSPFKSIKFDSDLYL